MKAGKILFIFIFVFGWNAAFAQDGLTERFRRHIETLADDSFEGRATGTEGEKKAREYIAAEFSAIGLAPKGDNNGWYQAFDFVSGRKYEGENKFYLNGKELELSKKWFPVPLGANGVVEGKPVSVGYGISAASLGHDDYAGKKKLAGKIFVIERSSPDGLHPHSKFIEHNDLRGRIALARKNGAIGVIVVNHDPDAESPKENMSAKDVREDIPVVYLDGVDVDALCKSKVSIRVNTVDIKTTGRNVIGYLDNGAPFTVVIGGHYDHLGWGDSHSLHRGERAIHNGADDNASGTGMVIELARTLKSSGSRNFNYLFIAFSGEELGLYGSKHYAEHPSLPLEKISYMLNFDMVGRMDNNDYKLGLNGTGTSPAWAVLDSMPAGKIIIKKSAGGIGPSDQTSFYLKNLPVLHFFSGTHADYHKPSDDFQKINYTGMNDIYQFVLELMKRMDNRGKLGFTATKNEEQGATPRFTVSLGVVPDYMYDGTGLRIDGVTEGKPAAAAGLQAGDVVIQLGTTEVKDMSSYMSALSKFKKGDKTTVKFKRGEETKEAEVTF